jgi:hypothetical protein
MEDKKISFSAQDAGLSSFIKNMRNEVATLTQSMQGKGKAVYGDFLKMAQEQTKNSKEQLKLINEQILALKKKLELEREYSRIVLAEQRKYAGEKEMDQIDDELARLKRRGAEDKALVSELRSSYIQQQEGGVGQGDPKKSSVFGDILKAGLVRDLGQMFRSVTSAQTGLDLMTPALGISGSVTGTIGGSILEAMTVGQIEYATIGAQMGKEFGQVAGQGITRHIQSKEKYLASALGVSSLTGMPSQAYSMSQYGYDLGSAAQLEQQMVRARGQAVSGGSIRDVAAISKFTGVETSSIMNLLRTTRMGGSQDETSIIEMLASGMNRSVLPDATEKLTAILQDQGQRMIEVQGGTALTRMYIGERMGGVWRSKDPRSAGLEAQYAQKLTSPSGAFAQALSYSVLRRDNPDASLIELKKLQQAGGIDYERGIMDAFGGMTGSGDLNTLLYSANFGQGTMAFDEDRFNKRDRFSRVTMMGGVENAISTEAPMDTVRRRAGDFTTQMQKDMAEANDAFVKGFTDGIEVITRQFKDRFLTVFDEFIDEKINGSIEAMKKSLPEPFNTQQNRVPTTPKKNGG